MSPSSNKSIFCH